MSKEIDQKVVEMRFDNRYFEQNVSTTMSSIRKLEESLKFKGATKGFDDLDRSSKKVDMTHLGKGLDMVQAKFSALQVIGTTALVNITNSAMAAGKKMISALTIDPVKTGFQEYETQMNAVQTILANTASKGSTLKDVNQALDELNTYADKTIYNFTEMTRNIGTFTAAGIDLETSVNSIQGIANLAAVSGSTSQQASTAMYQLSQALAAGTVKLMDWNSVVNAGMGGEMFQNALKETSKELGTGAEAAIKASGSFRESLKDGWLTAEVLTATLKKFTTSGANEYVAKYTGLSTEAVDAALKEAEARYGEADAIEKASEALAKKSGKNKDEIKSALQFAKNAEDAATKVKTFSQLWDVMKESAQSGWAQTWKLIIGDFEEAKNLLTPLADFFTGIIGKMNDARNKLLEGALGKTFTDLSKKIKGVVEPVKDVSKTVKTVTDTVKNYGEVVDKIIGGEFGNGKARIEALTKAGYDYAHAQNLVNEKLGSSVRHATKYKDAQKEVNKTEEKLTETEAERLEQLTEMSDAELKALGYSEKQIKAFRELKKESDKLGMSVKDFVNNIDKLDGRTILINSFKNIGQGLVKTFKAMGEAWKNVFPPATADQLYNVIAGFHKLSTNFKMSDETAKKLKQSFEGLFSILRIAMMLIGGPLSIAIKLAGQILGAFGIGILDITSWVGSIIIEFRRWLDSTSALKRIFSPFVDVIKNFVKIIKDAFQAFKESEPVQNLIEKLKDFGEAIKLDDGAADNFQKITDGLVTLSTKLAWVLNASLLAGLKVLGAVLNLFGTDLMKVAAAIIDYLGKAKKWANENIFVANTINEVAEIWKAFLDGIKSCGKAFLELKPVQKIIENFKKAFSGLKFDPDLSGFKNLINGITDAFSKFKDWIKSLDDSENIGLDIVKGLANGLKAGASLAIGKIIDIAKAIIDTAKTILGIHSPSKVFFAIGGFLIAGLIAGLKSDASGVWETIKAIGSNLITFAKDAFFGLLDFIKNLSLGEVLTIAMTAALIGAVKKVVDIVNVLEDAVGGFGNMCDGAGELMKSFAERINPKKNKFEEASKVMLKMAISIGILAAAVYVLAQLKPGQLWSAVGAILALAGVLAALTFAAGKMDVDGGTFKEITKLLISMSVSFFLLAKVAETIGNMDWSQLGKAGAGMAGLLTFMTILMLISKIGNFKKIGTMLMKMAGALLILTLVSKLIAGMEWSEMEKAAAGLGGLVSFMALLMLITKIGNAKKAGAMLMQMAGAMLLLVIVGKMIAKMEWSEMGKAAAGLLGLIGFTALLMLITKIGNFKKVGSMLLQMSGAIAILAVTARMIAGMEWSEMGKAAVGILGLGAIIAGLMWATKLAGGGNLEGVGATLLSASIAIGILAGIAILLGMVPIEKLQNGVVAVAILGTLMAMMIAATAGAEKCVGNIVAMSVAIAIMAGAVAGLSFIEPAKLITASVSLGLIMGMFALLTTIAGQAKGSLKSLAALGIMTLALGVLSGALYLVSNLPIENALASAAALSVLMLSLSVSMMLISNVGAGAIAGAAALIIIAGALAILTPCLQALGGMSLAQIGAGLLGLAGAFAVIGVAGLLLGPITPMILALSVGIAAIGVGCMAAGVGLMTFSLGLQTLVMMGPAGAAAVTLLVTTILNLIPMIAVALANGIVQFATTIAAGATTLAAAIVTVVNAIIAALVGTIPNLLAAAGVLLTAFLNFIVTYIPKMVDAGMKLIKGILQGIANNIGGIVKAATDIVVNFLNAISRNLGRVIDAGIKLMISFINGLANGIRNNTGQMISAINNLMDAVIGAVKAYFSNFTSKGKELIGKMIDGVKSKFSSFKGTAKDMMDGFIKGVKEKFSSIKNTAVNAIKGAVDGVKSFLGIKSPSRVFMKIGRYTDEGFALGLKKYAKLGVVAAKNMGEGALEGLKDVLGVNSPATEGIDIGAFLTEGFAIGIEKLRGVVANAGKNVGSIATKAIGEGIKKDMTAEEQAKKKADNIANAFKTKFDEIDREGKKFDLELELGVIDEDTHLEKSINLQADRVANAWEEYQTKLATLGEDSEHTKTAYNAYLQELADLNQFRKDQEEKDLEEREKNLEERNDLLDRADRITELEYEIWEKQNNETATESQKAAANISMLSRQYNTALERLNNAQTDYANSAGKSAAEVENARIAMLEAQSAFIDAQQNLTKAQESETERQKKALLKYNQYLSKYGNELRKMGVAEEDIIKAAQKSSGYDPNYTATKISETTSSTAGAAFVQTFGESIQNGVSSAISTTKTLVTQCATAMAEQTNEWEEAGKQLASAFVSGLCGSLANNPELSGAALQFLSKTIEVANSGATFTPTIRPLTGGPTGNIFGGTLGNKSLELAGINAEIEAARAANLANIESKLDSINASVRGEVIRAINDVRSDFSTLAKAIDDIDIRLDSGVLVGELTGKIDRKLGQIANHKGRGN